MSNGYVLRTLNLPEGLTISLVDKNGQDLNFEACTPVDSASGSVKYDLGDGGALEIGPKLGTLQMPDGEKILFDQAGITFVMKGDQIDEMRRPRPTVPLS